MLKTYKLILVLSGLCVSPLALSTPDEAQQARQELILEVCDLMQHVSSVQQYWQEINHSLFKKITTTLPHRWLSRTWRNETPLKADLLQALFDKVATFLGSLDAIKDPQAASAAWADLEEECQQILSSCAIPSVLERHWAACTISSIALAAVYAHTKHKLNGQYFFKIDKGSPALKGHVDRIATPQGPHVYLDTYRYSQDKEGHQFIEVAKTNAPVVRNFLQEHQVSNFEERTPTIPDLETHFYNEDGNTYINEWVQNHCIQPCNKLYKILFTDRQETDFDSLKSNTKAFQENLHAFENQYIKNAAVNPIAQGIIKSVANDTPLEHLTPNQKELIHNKIVFYFHENGYKDVMDALNDAFHKVPTPAPPTRSWTRNLLLDPVESLDPNFATRNFIIKWIPTFDHILNNIRQNRTVNDSEIALAFSTFSLSFLKREDQANTILNNIGREATRQSLTLAMMSTIPLAITGYLIYRGTDSVIKKISKRTFIAPLKQDLLSLELTLNSNSHRVMLTTHTKGLCLYWTTRLTSYIKKMSTKERPRYALYIEQLNNQTLSAQQKIQIIECMFKEFSFLQ